MFWVFAKMRYLVREGLESALYGVPLKVLRFR
jgi:hypothetical protein